MKPHIGDSVHYVSYGTPGGEYASVCRAAVITAVRKTLGWVDLCVLNPEGMFFNRDVGQDERLKRGGTWHWPEQIED